MPCAVSNASPFADPGFDDGWEKIESPHGGSDGLSAVAEFNASFEGDGGNNTIDPRLAFCKAPTPVSGNDYFDSAGSPGNADIDHSFNPEAPTFNTPRPEFVSEVPGSPYFRSIEDNPAPAYHASPLRNNYRRSVSEPPGGMPMGQPSAPTMMFHRENHYLGKPILQKPTPLKSLPKHRQPRQHPYSRNVEQQQHQQQHQEQQQQSWRPEHRRAHTQPIRSGPRSAPFHSMPQQYFPQPVAQQSQSFSSRMCTPVAEGVGMSPLVDPMVNVMVPQMPQTMKSNPKNVMSIPVTVDEFRAMIFDAVHEAIDGLQAKKDIRPSKGDKADAEQAVIFSEVEERIPEASEVSQQ